MKQETIRRCSPSIGKPTLSQASTEGKQARR